jgi:hypothetical protein
MKRFSLFFVLSLVLCASSEPLAQSMQPPDRVLLVDYAQELEAQPFSSKAKDHRAWAVAYVIQTDSVSVVICGGELTAPFTDKKNKFGSELLGQYMIGMAAFKLTNPSQASDENAAQLAGLTSAIKAYRAMLKEKPKAEFQAMNDLAAKFQSGELKTLVEKAGCGKGKVSN